MIKNYLRQIRLGKDLSLKDVARGIGKTPQAVSQFELGRRKGSEEMIEGITKFLGVTRKELFNGIVDFNQELLVEAMNIAQEHAPDLDKEFTVKITAQIYKYFLEYEEVTKQGTNSHFEEELEEQFIMGIAAKGFLNNHIIKNRKSS